MGGGIETGIAPSCCGNNLLGKNHYEYLAWPYDSHGSSTAYRKRWISVIKWTYHKMCHNAMHDSCHESLTNYHTLIVISEGPRFFSLLGWVLRAEDTPAQRSTKTSALVRGTLALIFRFIRRIAVIQGCSIRISQEGVWKRRAYLTRAYLTTCCQNIPCLRRLTNSWLIAW